jgi:hypothetical protein
MEKFSPEELKAYLINSNEEYRSLANKHAEYKRLIEAIEQKPHITPEDEDEEHRLKNSSWPPGPDARIPKRHSIKSLIRLTSV